MKYLKYFVVIFMFVNCIIITSCNSNKVTQNQLRSSVLIFKQKFLKANKITVFIHNPIYDGEEFKEIKKINLTSDQVSKLISSIDLLLENKMSYADRKTIVVPYDITIVVECPTDTELITITANKAKIKAHSINPYLIPTNTPSRSISGVGSRMVTFLLLVRVEWSCRNRIVLAISR